MSKAFLPRAAELTTWSMEVSRTYLDDAVRLSLRVPERARYKLEKYRIGATDRA